MKENLKILSLCHHPKNIGTYVRAYNLSKSLAMRGHDVTLVAVSPDSRLKSKREREGTLKIIFTPRILHEGFFINRLTSGRGWGPLDIIERIRIGMSYNYDIIHTYDHFANVAIPFKYLRKKTSSKFVSDWCDVYHLSNGFYDTPSYRLDGIYKKIGFMFRNYLKTMEIYIRQKADATTVISQKLKKTAVDSGVDSSKISVIEGGVDTDKIKPLLKKDCRKKIGLSIDSKVVVFLGRSQFDLDILIKAFAKVKHYFPISHLIIVGQCSSQWPRKLAANLGIANRYVEVGYCSEEMLPTYLGSADIFAMPMKKNLMNETRWPNKIGEYMASGRPTVVSDVGDVAEIVEKYGIGLVAKTDVDSFAEKMQILFSNEIIADDMGSRARCLACEKYSWTEKASRLEEIYFQLLRPNEE